MKNSAAHTPDESSGIGSIVIIDDSPDDLMLLRRALQKVPVGKAIYTFEQPTEALAHLRASIASDPNGPRDRAVVFCDLKMPKMDGFAVLSYIRSQPPLDHVSVIIISGCALQDDVEKARQLGANGYVEKMPSPETLTACLVTPHFPPTGSRPERFKSWEARQ